ncbi:hypothetical protein AVEN_197683-1 [Araneus ventricosus]|uniref:Uncharacterized protein n=1 Tax=Araneus ventricosus TaxID=182803 RepID=A0A4Y2W3Q2_ARAVE|nr:hypothetical protein AVEN_197683-1 [Araneus ventricosus]
MKGAKAYMAQRQQPCWQPRHSAAAAGTSKAKYAQCAKVLRQLLCAADMLSHMALSWRRYSRKDPPAGTTPSAAAPPPRYGDTSTQKGRWPVPRINDPEKTMVQPSQRPLSCDVENSLSFK